MELSLDLNIGYSIHLHILWIIVCLNQNKKLGRAQFETHVPVYSYHSYARFSRRCCSRILTYLFAIYNPPMDNHSNIYGIENICLYIYLCLYVTLNHVEEFRIIRTEPDVQY